MTARELMEKLIKLDSLDTKIDFKLPIKLFGQDEDLLLEFNHLFYPDNDSFKPNFIISFKEKK
tara:strand:+ start:237 stop:425 length:189 start_codon:yes stop_codon:yes gene_type:complete